MKLVLLAAVLMLAPSGQNYKVVPVDSRRVVVVCTTGQTPLVSESASQPNVVMIKCMDPK